MTCKDVTTQQELDTALADDDVTCVHIQSEAGVWLRLNDNGNATVDKFAREVAPAEAVDR